MNTLGFVCFERCLVGILCCKKLHVGSFFCLTRGLSIASGVLSAASLFQYLSNFIFLPDAAHDV